MITLETQPHALAVPPHHEEAAIAPLVLAFATDPVVRWMYPEAHQFRTFFPRFVRAFGGQAFALGTASVAADYRATALWLPPGVMPDDEALVPLLEGTVTPERLREVFALLEQMGAFHPAEPHWYLPLLGVDPRHQRQGLGSALLESTLARLDRDGMLAYLEATSPENVPFYERHRFELHAEIQAGSSPRLFAMIREPR